MVARLDDLPAGRGWPVRVGGRSLAVFACDGEVYAVDNVCRHNGNPIDDGPVADGIVTCPWHGWSYALATGELVVAGGRIQGLDTYPTRVDDGRVLVSVDA